MIELIGISGPAGSGKDFLAQHALRPLGYTPFSLAWAFKVALVGRGQATHEDVFVIKPPAVRKMLQLAGTEEGRNVYGEQVWCETMYEWFRVLAENAGITKYVCADVRFPNEAEFIKAKGGKVYRIVAPVRVAASPLTAEARQHISETALDNYTAFDGIILNDPGQDGVSQLRELVNGQLVG